MARERSNWHGSSDSDEDRMNAKIRASDKEKSGRVVDLKGISNARLRNSGSGDRYKESSKNRYRDEKERERSARKESQFDGLKEAKRDKEISDKQIDSKRKEHLNEEKRNRYQKEAYTKSEKHRDEKYRHREEREKYSSINKQSYKDERESKHHFKDERENTKYRDEENNNRGRKRVFDEKEGLSDFKGKNVKETMKRANEDNFGDLKGRNEREVKYRDEDFDREKKWSTDEKPILNDSKGKGAKETLKETNYQNRNNNSRQGEEEHSQMKGNNNNSNWNNSKNWNNNSRNEEEEHTQTNRNNWNNNSKNWNKNSRQEEDEHAQTNRSNWNSNSKNWNNNSRHEEEEHAQLNRNNWNNNSKNRNYNSQAFGSFERDRNPNFQNRNFHQKSNFIRLKRAGSTSTFFGNRDHKNNYNNDNNNNNYSNNCNDSNNIIFENNLFNGASNIPYWPWPQRAPLPAGFHPLANQFPFNMRPQTLDLAQLASLTQNPLAQTLDLAQLTSLSQAQLTQTLDLTQLAGLTHGQLPIHPTLDLTQLTRLTQDPLPQTVNSTQTAPNIVHSQTLESNQSNQNHEEPSNQFASNPNPNPNPNQLALQDNHDQKDFPNPENLSEFDQSDKLVPSVNTLKDQNEREKISEEKIAKKAKKESDKSPFCYDYYLSKIGGVSENLAEKGLYAKCMKLLQKDGTGTGTTNGNLLNIEKDNEPIKKSSNSNSNRILKYHFPTWNNESLFQKSLSHYKTNAFNSLNPNGTKEEVLEASISNKMETDEEISRIEIRAESSTVTIDEDQNVTTSISCKNAMEVDLVPSIGGGEKEGVKNVEGEFADMSGKNVVFASGAQSCEGVLLPDNCKVGLSQIPC